MSIWIKAYTMSLNAYETLSIRVCGQETIALTSASRRFHLLGFARGNPSTMADATRYMSITQATFNSYFAVAPAGDPCII